MWLGSATIPLGSGKLSLLSVERRLSPNLGPRKGGVPPSLIVLHYTAMPDAQAALERLSDPAHEVSAHYFLDQSGGAVQLVPEAQRAWHAGEGAWGDCTDINSASIGIELCNAGDHAFPAAQIQVLKSLLKEVMQRWGIAAQGVIGHSDMAPGRKQDPGRWFEWQDLARDGLAVYRGAPHSHQLPFLEAAERFGYRRPEGANSEQTLLEAFRQRFRPKATGPLGEDDLKILSDLAQTYPAAKAF